MTVTGHAAAPLPKRCNTVEPPELTVYYDGSCPLCRREINFFKRLSGEVAIAFQDVSLGSGEMIASDLTRSDALARFHVRLGDGRLACGARGFAELWSRIPGFRALGSVARMRFAQPMLEVLYQGFLALRPILQSVVGTVESVADCRESRWLERELRADHAGETGAVAIYRGILAVSRSPRVRSFALRHLATERRHLKLIDGLLPGSQRSKLLPLWTAAGFTAGALPAMFGSRAVFATIDAVESFVDQHYLAQIDSIGDDRDLLTVSEALQLCRADELAHRDEARSFADRAPGPVLRVWLWAVGLGSALAVPVARRI
jgi:demethoxyubiquinone hydroxylase (CLK1/Coq7/Cat5 family)